VRAAIPVDGADERPLDVQRGDHCAGERIGLAQLNKPAEAVFHDRDMLGRDCRQETADAVTLHGRADLMELVGGEVVAMEVDAAVAVDLQVEVPARVVHASTAFSLRNVASAAYDGRRNNYIEW
jgi:hypothetical protein